MRLVLVLTFSLILISCGKHTTESTNKNGVTNINEIKGEKISEFILNEDIASLSLYLSQDGDINFELKNGRTLLTEACYWGKLKVIEFLVAKNVDVERLDKNGNKADDFAVDNIKIRRILYPQLVIEQKIKLVNLVIAGLVNEFKKAIEDLPDVNFYLLKDELSIETGTNEGETLLTLSIKAKQENIVRLLASPKLELNVNQLNKFGESPLYLSRQLKLKNAEKILLKLGAKE